MNSVKSIYRNFRNKNRNKKITSIWRKNLTNINPTIICSDCTAGMIYHDLQLEFKSPTINMFFPAKDFIHLCYNLKQTMEDSRFVEIPSTFEYPIAEIGGGISAHLVHYPTVEEARGKWNQRKKRINWDNLFFIMNDRNGCTEEDIFLFDSLPYNNKVFFSHRPYPKYESVYHIKGFEKKDTVGIMTSFSSPISISRNFDQFDVVSWLNVGGNGSEF